MPVPVTVGPIRTIDALDLCMPETHETVAVYYDKHTPRHQTYAATESTTTSLANIQTFGAFRSTKPSEMLPRVLEHTRAEPPVKIQNAKIANQEKYLVRIN